MIVVSEQVQQALQEGRPVVAMESTIFSTLGPAGAAQRRGAAALQGRGRGAAARSPR